MMGGCMPQHGGQESFLTGPAPIPGLRSPGTPHTHPPSHAQARDDAVLPPSRWLAWRNWTPAFAMCIFAIVFYSGFGFTAIVSGTREGVCWWWWCWWWCTCAAAAAAACHKGLQMREGDPSSILPTPPPSNLPSQAYSLKTIYNNSKTFGVFARCYQCPKNYMKLLNNPDNGL